MVGDLTCARVTTTPRGIARQRQTLPSSGLFSRQFVFMLARVTPQRTSSEADILPLHKKEHNRVQLRTVHVDAHHTTKSAIVPWPALSERDGREDEGEGQGRHRRPDIEAADFVQNSPREIWIFDSLESLAVHLPHAALSDVAQAALSRCEVGQSKGEQRRRGEATPESSLLDHEPSIQHKDKNQQDTTQDLALRALGRVDVRQLRSG